MTSKTEWKYPVVKPRVTTKYGWIVLYTIDKKTSLKPLKTKADYFHLGYKTDIGYGTVIQAQNYVYIGNFVQIGANCSIYSSNTIDNTKGKIIIKDNAKIGANSVILPKSDGSDLIIGYNSIIGAGSVVKTDIPSNMVFVGAPARYIKNCHD